MRKPTQKQIKEFWEWCGLELHLASDGEYHWFEKDRTIVSPVDSETQQPIIDLNALFEYAVPKIDFGLISFALLEDGRWMGSIDYVGKNDNCFHEYADDPALALFWALWQVKESK